MRALSQSQHNRCSQIPTPFSVNLELAALQLLMLGVRRDTCLPLMQSSGRLRRWRKKKKMKYCCQSEVRLQWLLRWSKCLLALGTNHDLCYLGHDLPFPEARAKVLLDFAVAKQAPACFVCEWHCPLQMICASRVLNESIWFSVPVIDLISQDVIVPMLLASKILGSSYANVQIHLAAWVCWENQWNHLDD